MSQEIIVTEKIKGIDLKNCINVSQYDRYNILAEQAVSLEKVYIVDLAVKRVNDDLTCAVSTSSNVTEVYKLSQDQFKLVSSLDGHSNHVTSVRFCHESDNLLYTSSLDGKIKLWDLRTSDCVKELKDSGLKPLTCMDISSHDRILAAGTELVEGDAFLLFWDIRSRQLLGGYWESHTDDITSLAFHPNQPDMIISSSTDGLVNLFDLKEQSEDDALLTSLNTESSVSRARWVNENILSAITHTETIQLWDKEGAAPEQCWSREQIGEAISAPADDVYVVDVHRHSDGDLFLLAGSHGEKGDCLHTISLADGNLKPDIPLVGNRQIIRTSHYIPDKNLIVTGGESGLLCIWKPGTDKLHSGLGKKAVKSRNKQKHRPY